MTWTLRIGGKVETELMRVKMQIEVLNPMNIMDDWLIQEESMGSSNPRNIVLATASKKGIPHSRIVAIREISERGILFFTQRSTRKVIEINENPHASMTLWLPLQQREVIIEGKIATLNQEENEHYWNLLPYERKLQFSAYSPISNQPIHGISELEGKVEALKLHYNAETLPMSSYYCGYRLVPEVFYFYTLGTTTFSEVIKYSLVQDHWQKQLLSP